MIDAAIDVSPGMVTKKHVVGRRGLRTTRHADGVKASPSNDVQRRGPC